MKCKINDFLNKREEDSIIVYPKGVSYAEKNTIFDVFKGNKIIKINIGGNKKNKRR